MNAILHLGCGRAYMDGAVNVDISPDVRADLAYELRWAWMFPAWFLSIELEALK